MRATETKRQNYENQTDPSFIDLPPGGQLVTNSVTFQVDLSAQFPAGVDPSSWNERLSVSCLCSFNAWEDFSLTNDPSASNTNLFSSTVTIISLPGTPMEYGFGYSLSWSVGWDGAIESTEEQPLSTGGANRSFRLLATNGTLVVPVVLFGDLEPSDILPTPTLVHFNVDMAGAVGTDGHAFDPAADQVFVNGDFVWWEPSGAYSGSVTERGWAPWDPSKLAACQLTNVPGTQVCSASRKSLK